MPEHPSEMLLLELLFVGSQPQLEEGLAHLFLEQASQDLEGRLHGVLTPLTVALLERLAEVEDLRETVCHLQTLKATRELE